MRSKPRKRKETKKAVKRRLSIELSAILKKDEKYYVALCPEVDVVSQGKTVEEGLKNLKEAVELYLEEFTRIRAFMQSPNLNTVVTVENTIKNAENSLITMPELTKKLQKKVSHKTLKAVLEYLEESNKISMTAKGITWIHNTNPGLRNAIRTGREL